MTVPVTARLKAALPRLGVIAGVALSLSACVGADGRPVDLDDGRPLLGDARNPSKVPFFPDTGSMNAERFGDQTFPVFMQPTETPYALQPQGSQPPQPGYQAPPTSTKLDPSRVRGRQSYYPSAPSSMGQQSSLGRPLVAPQAQTRVARLDPDVWTRYGSVMDGGHLLPAIPIERVNPGLLRQKVAYATREKPGTLVVDTRSRFLYLVEGNGQALRYGVGLGRQGYAWSGRGVIRTKQKWPRWTPTEGMADASTDINNIKVRGGMIAGSENPLGARALYIYKDGKDTLYRVHGTPDWQSVGKQASSGCVRMYNQDVVDLYNRVRDGAVIVVM
ncbi:L,D-transpeptidase [Rhizobium sp. C1]|uniref:L,D-transpeptidase n=1 Tax=Rhizobium sp. C1 TaxID=1349799 RepID=UPI001E3077C3|nr:L,D-transpeptidase [Rhizobium sp. C1]MCD2176572.1 L,D-transpeptidase [Rhizobium sp. C1]